MRAFGRLAASLLAAAGIAAGGAAAPGLAAAGDDHDARGARQIQHVLVLMQENRSFDSYFGQLHFEGQPRSGAEPRNASNPNPLNDDASIRAFHQTAYCEVADLNHSWTGTHNSLNGDEMDGFTAANAVPADPPGSRAMGFYDIHDLPFYYSLYSFRDRRSLFRLGAGSNFSQPGVPPGGDLVRPHSQRSARRRPQRALRLPRAR